MSIRSLTYRTFSWLEAPKISIELLWVLVLVFAGLGIFYLVLVFRMRNRISARREAVRLQKREIAPMISNFLFYQHESEDEDREEYIRMKIEIREMLKVPLNREVMTEVLMDLRMDVSGEARERLLRLFQDLGLDQDSFRRLESWRWERVSQGIMELTEMQVEKAYPFIRKFINDRRGVIRKQAQMATVMLREEGISYFLDTARYRISEWQQLKLLEILRQREDFNPPRFKAWLTSENRDVVLFALRLIRYYRQNDVELALITLLRHRNQTIRAAALEGIREFRCHSALEPIKSLFPKSNEELKLLILDTLGLIASQSELAFLAEIASRDGNFVVRSKARAVMNTLKPDSALPVVDLTDPEETPEETAIVDEKVPSEVDADASDSEGDDNLPSEAETFARREASPSKESDPPNSVEEGMPAFGKDPTPTSEEQQTLPEWEEDEAVFDVCFLEELEEILSEIDPPEEPEGILPLDFLPIVTEASVSEKEYPEGIHEMEVVSEWVTPHELIRLSDRFGKSASDSTFEPLNNEFLPWVVSEWDLPEEAEPLKEPAMQENANFSAEDFPCLWEPLFELDGVSQPAKTQGQEGYFKGLSEHQEEDLGRFSIFSEFFREYDTESKLILLEQIPEVGEEKEWEFLRGLLEDPEPAIRAKASQMLKVLGNKLGIPALPAEDAPLTAFSPEVAAEHPGMELNFTPETPLGSDPKTGAAAGNTRQRAARWLRWARKGKSQRHG